MIAAIENAIADRINKASKSGLLGYAFREIASLPLDTDEALAERAQQFPAAWTVFGGYKPIGDKGEDAKVRATFYVVVAAQHLGNETARRLAEGANPGAYQLAEDVVGLLLGQRLGLDIEPFKLGDLVSLQSALKVKRSVALFAQGFTTDFVIEARPDADLYDFDELHVNWDVRPFGGVDGDPDTFGLQLPADDQADATTHINLRQEA